VIVRTFYLHRGDNRLIPEQGLAAKLGYAVDPILDELTVGRSVKTDLIGVHNAVSVIAVCLGVIGEEVPLVTGRAANAPVVYPDL